MAQQSLEVILGAEAAAFVAAREGRGVQDDCIKLFFAPGEAGQDVKHIVGKEAVCGGIQSVECEIEASPVEGLLREVHGEGFGARECCDHGEGAGVGKRVEDTAHGLAAQ